MHGNSVPSRTLRTQMVPLLTLAMLVTILVAAPRARASTTAGFVLTPIPCSAGLANDDFACASVIPPSPLPQTVTGTNVGSSQESGEPHGCTINPDINSVWWRWTAATSGPVLADTMGSAFNTQLGIYTGPAVDSLSNTACNDDLILESPGAVRQSMTSFQAVAGTTYYLQVRGFEAPDEGTVQLTLSATRLCFGQLPDIDMGRLGLPSITTTNSQDVVLGSSGNDTLDLVAGNDLACMGDGDDHVWSRGGEDKIDGEAGNDVIFGGDGDDVILTGAGNDTVFGEDGSDEIEGAAGHDRLIGGLGNDIMSGDDGNDLLRGNAGQDTLIGGSGSDRLFGGTDDDIIDGGIGNDYIGGFGGADTITGGPGSDTIYGGFGADVIDGGSGDDSIYGLVGNDTIDGGSGADTIEGNKGNDLVNGGVGNDNIGGGNGDDVLNGNEGNDIIGGGQRDDVLSGGADTDVCAGNKHINGDTDDGTCEQLSGANP